MSVSPPFDREAERLALLGSVSLSTDGEARFNELIELAAFVAHTPMATIAIVEAESVWFKASLGFESNPISRRDAFCSRTVQGTVPEIIADAVAEPWLADSPLVQDLGVRFYAGFPLLVHDGLAVGTICVMDRRPRNLLSDERQALRIIADQAAAQLRVSRLEAMLPDES